METKNELLSSWIRDNYYVTTRCTVADKLTCRAVSDLIIRNRAHKLGMDVSTEDCASEMERMVGEYRQKVADEKKVAKEAEKAEKAAEKAAKEAAKAAKKEAEKESEIASSVNAFVAEQLGSMVGTGRLKGTSTLSLLSYAEPGNPPVSVNLEAIARKLAHTARSLGYKKCTYDACLEELRYYRDKLRVEYPAKLISTIGYDADCVEAADELLDYFYDFYKPLCSREAWHTIIRHWMWQVKRKVMGRSVIWHLMVNFRGNTGIGKSTFVRKLIAPFEASTANVNVDALLDTTRHALVFSEYYVAYIDELVIQRFSGLGRDIVLNEDENNAVKSKVTEDTFTYREMGTNRLVEARNVSSIIASSNKFLADIIYDRDTMRRFFEFTLSVTKPEVVTRREEYDAKVTDEAILTIWRSVDEDLEKGYWLQDGPVYEEIAKIQSALYPMHTSSKYWIEKRHIGIAGEGDTYKMSFDQVYNDYRDWCRQYNNGYSRPEHNFIEDLRHYLKMDPATDPTKAEYCFVPFLEGEKCDNDTMLGE